MLSVRSAVAGLLLACAPGALADTVAVGPAELPLVAAGGVAEAPAGGAAESADGMLAPAAAVPVTAAVAPAAMSPAEARPVFNLSGGSDMVPPRAPATNMSHTSELGTSRDACDVSCMHSTFNKAMLCALGSLPLPQAVVARCIAAGRYLAAWCSLSQRAQVRQPSLVRPRWPGGAVACARRITCHRAHAMTASTSVSINSDRCESNAAAIQTLL